MQFVNREEELRELNALIVQPGAVLYRLVGRRRTGKTSLLAKACEAHRGVYLFVPEGEEAPILAELRRQAGEAAGGDLLAPEGWDGLLRFLERFEGRPVVFDEFQHLIEASSTAVSLFQHVWDLRLRKGNHKWFLAGSSIGMMRRLTTGTRGALFGRLTQDRRLKPFLLRHVALLYPGFPATEILTRYAIFGGTPHYHSLSVARPNLEEAVRASLLDPAAPFRDEPTELLRRELAKPARYDGILAAIGANRRTLEEIRQSLHLDRVGDITRYLAYLRDDLGLVVPDLPVPTSRATRGTRYRLEDPFFEFYYRFVAKNRPALEVGALDLVWRQIRQELPSVVGATAERACHQLLVARNGGELAGVPIEFKTMGRWWGAVRGDRARTEEVDVVAIGPSEVLVGEVKWQGRQVGPDVWGELERKGDLMQLPRRLRRRYLVVSKGGFSQRFKDEAPEGSIVLDGERFLREVLRHSSRAG